MPRFRPASTTVFSTLSTGSNNSFQEESPQSLVCPVCNVQHATIDELLKHQSCNRHFACDECEQCYWTQEGLQLHKRNDHPAHQDLQCPGCQCHFTRVSLFWKHIENSQCRVIFPGDIARQRERKLEFAKQLELRGRGLDDILLQGKSHIKNEDTWASHIEGEAPAAEPMAILNRHPSALLPNTRPISITPDAHPVSYRNEDFPAIPSEQEMNAWEEQKVLFPDTSDSTPVTYNAVPPPTSHSTTLAATPRKPIQQPASNNRIQTLPTPANPAESGEHTTTSSGRIVDPNHPDFNAAVFYNSLLNKFVCPYKICRKKFNSAHTLVGHLRSPAHTGGRLGCICCKKIFTTPVALIEHMETTTTCAVRDTDNFRRALGDLTGGLIDVDTRSRLRNNTTKFVINEKAFRELRSSVSGSNTGLEKKGNEKIHASAQEQQEYWNNPDIHW
ncbi:hypothetical protein HD806DRAFT_545634 [Xylariaceae sp. AK1471]|nr:hypothetical protein HD806DRAFT_545634 [Xylariaceae sp. AK1471]